VHLYIEWPLFLRILREPISALNDLFSGHGGWIGRTAGDLVWMREEADSEGGGRGHNGTAVPLLSARSPGGPSSVLLQIDSLRPPSR
jgi:hypothetical protein